MNQTLTILLITVLALGGCPAFPMLQAQDSLMTTARGPSHLPVLSVWKSSPDQHGNPRYLIAAEFPDLPGQLFDAWCFEGPYVRFNAARALDGGGLELRHTFALEPPFVVVTTVTPERDAVEFTARAELVEAAGSGTALPNQLRPPNICWQVIRAPMFASKPNPYPAFMERCFLYTWRGLRFLHQTTRNPIQDRPADAPVNNPPWVQRYLQAGTPERNGIAMNTTDRFVIPVIGVLSKDRRYLAAIANDSASLMSQMYHDCLHNNPEWLPMDAPPEQREWRFKYYILKNDTRVLLKRVAGDFPKLGEE